MQLFTNFVCFLSKILVLFIFFCQIHCKFEAYYKIDVSTENWTSCDEFLKNTTLEPNSITGKEWKIFYVWSYYSEAPFSVRFRPADINLVARFKLEMQKYNQTINWSRSVLFMEASIDISALVLTTEVSGKFRLIPSGAFEMGEIPEMLFGFKVVEPGYLGILNCQNHLCYALAPEDKMPSQKDRESAAKRLGYVGHKNYSYVAYEDKEEPLPKLSSLEGGRDEYGSDEQVEVENNAFQL